MIIFKHSAESTEKQTDTEQTNTLILPDFGRSTSKTVSRWRVSHEEKKHTYEDLHEDLACQKKVIGMYIDNFQCSYVAAVKIDQEETT